MKRIRIVGLCMTAVFGMTAALASAAQAAPEYGACLKLKKAEGQYSNSTCSKVESQEKGKYEIGSAVGVAYKSKTGTAVLSTPDLGGKVTCVKSEDKGKITGPTTGEDQVTFEQCETEGKKCSSKGEKAGTIKTAELETILAEKEGKPAVEFVSNSGREGYQAEFECEGLLIRTKGYTIGVIISPEEGVYSLKTDTKFAGEENLLTEVSIDGGNEYLGPFPSEEKVEATNNNNEALAFGLFGPPKPKVKFKVSEVPLGGPYVACRNFKNGIPKLVCRVEVESETAEAIEVVAQGIKSTNGGKAKLRVPKSRLGCEKMILLAATAACKEEIKYLRPKTPGTKAEYFVKIVSVSGKMAPQTLTLNIET